MVASPISLPELTTLGDAYGTGTLYCTPSPSATPAHTPWSTPTPTPRFHFFHRKGSCPTPVSRSLQAPGDKFILDGEWRGNPSFLMHAALPVVSCALAPVSRRSASTVVPYGSERPSIVADITTSQKQFDQLEYPEKLRRSTYADLPAVHNDFRKSSIFSSQTELCSLINNAHSSNRTDQMLTNCDNELSHRANVPAFLDIEAIPSPVLTSISSNDTFLTANTGTPQENSKYSFHSLLDSSLDSYLTLTLSSPNASPPSLSGGMNSYSESPVKHPLLSQPLIQPKSILKKEQYSLPDYAWYTPTDYTNNQQLQDFYKITERKENGYIKKSVIDLHKMDPSDRDRLESVKKLISEKIVNSIAHKNKIFSHTNFNIHRQLENFSGVPNANNDVLETHL